MVQKSEVILKIAQILDEVNQQFETLTTYDTDINCAIFNAKVSYLSNYSQILSKLNNLEKIESSLEFYPNSAEGAKAEMVLENTFIDENLPVQTVNEVKEDTIESKDVEHNPEPFVIVREAAPMVENLHFESPIQHLREPILPDEPVLKPVVNVVELPVATPKPEPVILRNETPIVKPTAVQDEGKKVSINDLFTKKNDENPTLFSSSHLMAPITDLKSAISLNDKMSFINELFNGYNLAYGEAVDILNKMESFEEAKQFLHTNYASKNNWASKTEVLEKFHTIIQKKYSK